MIYKPELDEEIKMFSKKNHFSSFAIFTFSFYSKVHKHQFFFFHRQSQDKVTSLLCRQVVFNHQFRKGWRE